MSSKEGGKDPEGFALVAISAFCGAPGSACSRIDALLLDGIYARCVGPDLQRRKDSSLPLEVFQVVASQPESSASQLDVGCGIGDTVGCTLGARA